MARKLGVHGDNLPTRKSKVVQPADFSIGGLICHAERKYDKAFLVQGSTDAREIFGFDINSSWYGPEIIDSFFTNIADVSAKLYVKSHVGYDGSVIDAVVASKTIQDQTPENLLTLQAGYQVKSGGALEYGVSGNRTGYTITNGFRFETTCATAGTKDDTFVNCSSVSDVKIGDTVKFTATAGGGATVYKVITAVDENAKTVSFSGAFHATANMDVDDDIQVMGIRLRVWRKDTKGIVTEVDKDLGKVFCSINALVTDYYIENVFATSKWIDATILATTPATPDVAFPADVATVTYLASGADGTAPTTAAHWSRDLEKMNSVPVRILGNPETSNQTIQQAGETYCKSREDNPKWAMTLPIDQTKSQLIALGNNMQRSDDVLAVMVADWIKITDPFASSPIAPKRSIPNIGAVMGDVIRTSEKKGVHMIPQKDTPLFGVEGLDNDNIAEIDDDDRTDLANAGINVIQFINGYGYVIRNFRTPSTSLEFRYFNALWMREFIKISGVDSLQGSENQPNSFERIQEDRDAMNQFMYNLWLRGSTGSVRQGETFGQSQNEDGSVTQFADHVQVIADITNNPQANINAGERNIDTYFTFPAPAESIYVRAGLWLR